MQLVIDIGNTRIKYYVFDGNIILDSFSEELINWEFPLNKIKKSYPGLSKAILSDVNGSFEKLLQFELKTSISQSEINEIAATSEEVSPMSLTITELQKRAEERRNKMKGFNYKFTDQMNKNIDEIERQPAYKRLGVSLDDTSSTISKSKTSLATDENEDIQLKSNNSFLHDNVD